MEEISTNENGDRIYDAFAPDEDWDMGKARPLDEEGAPGCESCEG